MTVMPTFAQNERAAAVSTMRDAGAQAPTLCEGWTVADLAAHLVLREHRPDVTAGMFLKPLASRTERIQRETAAKPLDELLDRVAAGPPKWSPMAITKVDAAMNLAEYFVHHEDVLRAADPAARRVLDHGMNQALFAVLPRLGKLALRSCRVGVVADAPGFGRVTLRAPKGDHGSVVLTGEPQEILLHVFGRGQVADVQVDGADRDVELWAESTPGF